ncbi:MAG: YcdB/YcdC domain-containing protein [Bacillota bacterium]
MRKIRLRLGVWCLLTVFLLTLFPGLTLAQEKSAVSLEQAIRIAKECFNIPTEYSNFTSGYNNYDNRQVWFLNWEATEEPRGSFNVQVDANTGEIIYMNSWKNETRPESGPQLPAISETQAREIANQMLNKLAPNKAKNLRLVPSDLQIVPLSQYGAVTYNFRWERVVNGIVFLGDGASISIRGDDGQVSHYNMTWTETDFPAAAGVVSSAKARETFEATGMLELQYYRQSDVRPLAAGEKQPVKLVYRLYHPSNGIIDALTGEPLVLEPGKWLRNEGGGGAGGAEDMMAQRAAQDEAAAPLSPEELKEIERTADLLSEEEAVAVVKKWVDIPETLTLRSANLAAEWQFPENRYWSLSWNAEKSETGQLDNASARVDARTGELMGFYLYYSSPEPNQPGNIDQEAAKKLAEDFLKKVQPGRFASVKLEENQQNWRPLVIEGQNPTAYYFNYRRLVNGIPYPGNGISVSVDAINQRITQFDVNWQNLNFPSPAGCLGTEQANAAYLKNQPLTLAYTQVYGSTGPGEVILVYLPVTTPNQLVSNLIDARTGEYLDRQGKPLSEQPRASHFTDIAGHFGEEEISLLGQAGIFGEYGDTFRPEESVTAVSLLRAMLQATQGSWATADLTDQEIIKRAQEIKWVEEGELTPAGAVTRENLAKLMIRLLGMDRAARIEGIYKVPYKDADALSPGSLGYASLTWGLEIIRGTGDTFNPNQVTTRAEAAVVLVRTLRVKA